MGGGMGGMGMQGMRMGGKFQRNPSSILK